jgi:Asp-tRNA(Asn)/Glu-tRNA(Gln) amidotransferase A subunit family amidase
VQKPITARRFAFVRTNQWSPADRPAPSPESIRAWDEAQTRLEAAGATVTELDLPVDFDAISRGLNMVIMHAEAATLFYPEYQLDKASREAGKSRVHEEILSVVQGEFDPAPTKAEYTKALDELARLRPIFDEIASEYDAIVTPSAPGIAPEGLEWTGDSRFCGMWTALHVPVVNIPAFASEEGMPLGLTLVSARSVSILARRFLYGKQS